MILINLLPPELRKKRVGINPVVVSAGVGGLAAVLLAGFLAYLHLERIPKSNGVLADTQARLEDAKRQAEDVAAKKARIAEVKQQCDKVNELLAQKVYWARTLDDFANMLTVKWPDQSFDARCTDLSVAPRTEAGAGAARGKGGIAYTVKAKFKFTGTREDEVGDYINAFFRIVRESEFWKRGFTGNPNDVYRADTRVWNESIKRVVFELPLEFTRMKEIAKPIAKGGAQ
jgi:hypothetical protein